MKRAFRPPPETAQGWRDSAGLVVAVVSAVLIAMWISHWIAAPLG